MKFPYGISDFYQIITEDYFYVDRTDRIRPIEEYGKSLLFLRPRRFGKSLLLSMLENYYDVNKASEFDRLFGHLAIAKNPTDKHNQYLILRWDFSGINSQGEVDQIRQSLYNHLNSTIERFALRYADLLSHQIQLDPNDALRSFQSLLAVVEQTPYRIYLLIDEYDNFANNVLMGGHVKSRQRYEDLVKGEGVLKTLFNVVKSATSGLGLDRTFITGVSPVVMSDITSGYNIAENIYLKPQFNDLCGFLEEEIATTLKKLVADCNLEEEGAAEILQIMRTFYNGYTFNWQNKQLVYNATLAIYFFKEFQQTCQAPIEMLDDNLAMDHTKLTYISRRSNGERLIQDALQEKQPVTIKRLATRFGIAEILATQQRSSFLASLLYYFGILTLAGRDKRAKLILRIPNLVVRRLYVEHLANLLLPPLEQDAGQLAAETLCSTGDIEPLCDFIEQRYYPIFDNSDYKSANELTLKTIFLTVLFNDTVYIMDAEMALERTYSDLTMIVRPEMRQYQQLDLLLEFKFVKLSKVELSGQEVKQKSREELLAIEKVKDKLKEATTQVKGYRKRLLDKYGSTLNLRTFAVVGLGFEKVVWEEVP